MASRIARALPVFALALCALAPPILPAQNSASAATSTTSASPTVLHPADLAKILPAEVFFHGQKASLQARNSGGVRWPAVHPNDDLITFAALVDTAGYSSALSQKYQACLITEVPLIFAGKQALPAGAYGVGFLDGGGFVIMDIGGHDLFTLPYLRDTVLKRPVPLEVIAGDQPGTFRLYSGRNYISFASAPNP
jgi:hypothetical protein